MERNLFKKVRFTLIELLVNITIVASSEKKSCRKLVQTARSNLFLRNKYNTIISKEQT